MKKRTKPTAKRKSVKVVIPPSIFPSGIQKAIDEARKEASRLRTCDIRLRQIAEIIESKRCGTEFLTMFDTEYEKILKLAKGGKP